MWNYIVLLLHKMQVGSKTNTVSIVYILLKILKVKVNKKTVQDTLIHHPAYPTLLSISDALKEWHVDNLALQLESIDQLNDLPLPFIAHLDTKNGTFVVVEKITSNTISYRESTLKYVHDSWNNFNLKWSGVILIAEANQQSGEYKFKENHLNVVLAKVRKIFLYSTYVILLSFLFYCFSKCFFITDWGLLSLKTIGFTLSILLVLKQLGSSNGVIDSLCTLGNKVDCNSVLNSPAAKIGGWLSWSYIGLSYFASGLLSLTFLIVNSDIRALIYSLPIFSLPVIFFSIYYQAKVVRTWCSLCLGVQCILIMEIVLVVSKIPSLPLSLQPYLLFTITTLIPISGLLLIIPLISDKINNNKEYDELLKIKRNNNFFNFLLSKQAQMLAMPSTLKPVLLGNPAATHSITLITNPICYPCRAAHEELKSLLHHNENVNANIIFAACDDRVRRLSAHILILSKTNEVDTLLSSWYDQPKLDDVTWLRLNPISADLAAGYKEADQHCEWCRQAGITSTPTIFIDGKLMPDIYKLYDLKWLLQSTK
jgi:uncharacterized membrane protein